MIWDVPKQIGACRFQDSVAGVRQARGFMTSVSRSLSDSRTHITAFPAAFRLQPPRVTGAVKHRKGQAKQQGVQRLAAAVGSSEAEVSAAFSLTGRLERHLSQPEKWSAPLLLGAIHIGR